MLSLSRCLLAFLLSAAILSGGARAAGDKPLRVAVLENSPPMAYRDASGELTGFSIGIIRALCEEMRASCEYHVTTLDEVVDSVATGFYDIGAVSLLDTPERRAKVLFAKPYFRSLSLWFARPGVSPGQSGTRVAVVHGSAQERYVRTRGWESVGVRTNGELAEPLRAGLAQAAIIPMSSAINLMKKPEFRELGLGRIHSNLRDGVCRGGRGGKARGAGNGCSIPEPSNAGNHPPRQTRRARVWRGALRRCRSLVQITARRARRLALHPRQTLAPPAAYCEYALNSSVMPDPELGGDASFAIAPARPELKQQIDAALERIKRNGTYDRVNSLFLPFRIN